MTFNTLRVRLIGRLSRLIGWFFGGFWALLGASALPHPYDRAGCALAVVIGLIFFGKLWGYEPPLDLTRPFFKSSAYLVAVAAELLGMYTAARVLPRCGAQQQIYSSVGCIVGLHFIGLWLATRSPRFLHITAGMCCVSLLSMFMPFTWRTIGARYLLLGAGNAIVLWMAVSGTD